MSTKQYEEFLNSKRQLTGNVGFDPVFMPEKAFPFQRDLIEWAVKKGRGALFADCGMGKTLMQLAWAENVSRHTGGRVLILTPLAVSHQTALEAEKFGIEVTRSESGELTTQILVTNYERLHHFNPNDFSGVVCDESSILKNYSGSRRHEITSFMQSVDYRLLCTATAAPNDWMELGTSSDALSVLSRSEMLANYFTHDGGDTSKWRLKGHVKGLAFWQWMASWARAIRKPSDLGYEDDGFILPELVTNQHIVSSPVRGDMLFNMPAIGLQEQREERKATIKQRAELVAQLVDHDQPAICWCHLNSEGDLLEKMIPGSVQVKGADDDQSKEKKFRQFECGNKRVMITKPRIGGFGLNWQHCSHQTYYPSHSFEQYYQGIRRSWRFGQKNKVTIDIVTSEGESNVMQNMQRKAEQADAMFENLVKSMGHAEVMADKNKKQNKIKIASWMK